MLTGAPSPRRDELMEAARRMGLADRVSFPGHLPEAEFAGLLAGSMAMIFPSLFEGFGMPVLEAMAAGVPVQASNLTSVPEIAGGAARLFDPRRPTGIADAIERIAGDPQLRADLIALGRERARTFPGVAQMAACYLAVFEEAARDPLESPPAIHGVFADGWTSGRMQVVFGRGQGSRRLTVKLKAPEWLPSSAVMIHVSAGGKQRIARGREASIECELPEGPGRSSCCALHFQAGRRGPPDAGCHAGTGRDWRHTIEGRCRLASRSSPLIQPGAFLERTIRSVLSQEAPTVEYFVMDGGNRDETVEILRRYVDALEWVSEKEAARPMRSTRDSTLPPAISSAGSTPTISITPPPSTPPANSREPSGSRHRLRQGQPHR